MEGGSRGHKSGQLLAMLHWRTSKLPFVTCPTIMARSASLKNFKLNWANWFSQKLSRRLFWVSWNLFYFVTMGNIFGSIFSISTWGESHGPGIGVVIDGCPPRLPLAVEDIQHELARRRPGQSSITTPRDEQDRDGQQAEEKAAMQIHPDQEKDRQHHSRRLPFEQQCQEQAKI